MSTSASWTTTAAARSTSSARVAAGAGEAVTTAAQGVVGRDVSSPAA
ncbi:MAG: hypothetical protein QM704_13380 [Anaeromyxobacteraceae bacterium]